MEGDISHNWRILVATLFSAVIIVGAYLLARGIESPRVAQASAESALLQAIATRDSDSDGLPDWEEALYGTDAHIADTFTLGMTDGEAVARGLIVPQAIADLPGTSTASTTSLGADGSLVAPAEGTITAAFAKSFFTLFVAAKQKSGGADLTESEMSDVATEALSSLASSITPAPDFKKAKDISVSGSGALALTAFAATAEAVFLKNTSNATTSEIHYLEYAVQGGDTSAYARITSIAKMYRDTATGLAVLPVPKELAADHLALVNAMMRVSQIAGDFTRADTDPLATILALQQYPQAVLAMGNAFIHIGTIYKTAGLVLPTGTPGASFVNMIENIAAKQAAEKKP